MKHSRSSGLWIGLALALVVAGIVALGARQRPSAALSAGPANASAASASPTPTPRDTHAAATPLPPPTTSLPQELTATVPAVSLPVTATPEPKTTRQVANAPTPILSPGSESAPQVQLTATPPASHEQIIGYSVQGRAISAYRIGDGPLKVVLVGDIHGEFEANTYLLAEQLLAHFLAHPGEVPAEVSLWIIPTMNPDGLATGHRWNANDVDLNRNADTDLDGCAGNDWSPDTIGLEGPHPGAGGEYPFSEPEARAVRDFLDDAQVAVFYHSAAEAIFADTCKRHAPSARLAEAISAGTGYPVPEEGWPGYPITGDFGDYLAGEGVAAVTVELTGHEDPEFDRNLEGVRSLLADVNEILSAEATEVGADLTWLDEGNTGVWRYADNSFIHSLALEVLGETAYLLDAGRVLALDLGQPAAPRLLLSPGDEVEGVRVLEPLDLAGDGGSLLALDRAGDVYRFDVAAHTWTLERYARPSGETSDHYFVALSARGDDRHLLETSHEQVWRFRAPSEGTNASAGGAWFGLPRSRDVDLSASAGSVYVLTRDLNRPTGSLLRYRDAREVASFEPNVDLMNPRQVVAAEAAVYVLDRSGRRVLALDPEDGKLSDIIQFPDRRPVSAIWAGQLDGAETGSSTYETTELILAGRDSLYFHGEPDRQATIGEGGAPDSADPHDLDFLEDLRGLLVPIEGATITRRDFQMPGAPRHYRLGVHEGIDFYSNTVGVPVNRRTPVHAVADGVVIRALVDYDALTAEEAGAWAAESRSQGYTPPDVLDGYRGRQVWIDHGNGLVSRYAHLGSIAPEVFEGATVTRGQAIATVGNSGTPSSVNSKTVELHLHLELWVGEHYVGQFLRPIEAREWLERILR